MDKLWSLFDVTDIGRTVQIPDKDNETK